MSFAENLKRIRREKNISQEELAELLNVSRQAVSKWEQGAGYPEMEKMLLLSERLNVSLDALVYGKSGCAGETRPASSGGSIMIKTYDGKEIVRCLTIRASHIWSRAKDVPSCALYGVDKTSFWGDNTVILGWYADEESLKKEMEAIWTAMRSGESVYELQYAAKVKKSFLSVKLVD